MRLLLLGLGALLAFASSASAADVLPTTTITVEGMHCAGCAKSLTTKLKTVKSVQGVEVDVTTGTAKVTAQPTTSVSPKVLWETVVSAGYKPTKLVGPSGTFTKKPDA